MSKKKSTIHFILTGGTIDSFYNGIKDTVSPNKHSVIPDYIKNLKLYEQVEFTEICMKDSRDLNPSDLKKILKIIQKSPSKRFIITQGTYTISDTARYLKINLKPNSKTIILTGSFIPLVGFSSADAGFNLGYSIAKIQDLDSGVYICMNGRVFSPEEVTKLISQGRFVSLFGERERK